MTDRARAESGRRRHRNRSRRRGIRNAPRLSPEKLAARQSSVPELSYPAELPITAHVDEIKALLASHQVIVVAGDTGSGKTTQLPKVCLAAGYGVQGMIGHTQPRRLAARAVASRVAEELGVAVGEQVGFSVRFTDQVNPATLVKMMTDGILLTEIRQDRLLRAYDLIIIDEAHERSLNIDFLLGYLKWVISKRPDLRVVITSATIDESAFSAHFNNAPVIRVSGRSYPVEVRYVDHTNDFEEQLEHCFDAVRRAPNPAARDVLMFLSGEREILHSARLLRRMLGEHWEILPLYARLSASEQSRVFKVGTRPRVVLATNVAETSLTVPNIGYVIDPGTARLSRYSYRSKLQRLPIEAISQASATQRAGRCGRIAPGLCFRLYSEDDFNAREAFTEPELRRSNLAAVVLQMRAFRLGDVRTFEFLNPPQPKAITDAERLLTELGALKGDAMSRTGKQMARLPVDPRLARMLVAAAELGSLAELLIITSALASQDPRERPLDKQSAADTAHEMFVDERSDFMAFLNIWRWLEQQRSELSSSAFRRALAKRFLSYVRVREWRSLHQQLRLACRQAGLQSRAEPASYAAIHQALITGSLSLLGLHDERGNYLGARGAKFQLFPGSGQHRRNPKWVIAAEIAETSRVYARCVAGVAPQWLERASRHLQKRSHSEPTWNAKRGEAMILERVVLYGLTLSERRSVRLAPVDPALARELFLRDGLVHGGLTEPPDFVRHNLDQVRQVLELEARGRRRDLLASEDELVAFYDERLPGDIDSAKRLRAWLRRAAAAESEALLMSPADVRQSGTASQSEQDYPGELLLGDLRLQLKYRFAPGEPDDGVNVIVPLGLLAGLVPEPFEWLVPGMLEARAEAMVRTLPKRIRRKLAPVPDHVNAVLPVLLSPAVFRSGKLTDALADALNQQFGVVITPADWGLERLDTHLQVNFQVRGKRGKRLGQGRNLRDLQAQLLADSFAAGAQARAELEQSSLTAFPDAGVPARRHLRRGGEQLVYPALQDNGDTVALVMCADPARADALNRSGYPRLARISDRQAQRYLLKQLRGNRQLGLYYASFGTSKELEDRVLNHLYWKNYFEEGPLPRQPREFAERLTERTPGLVRAYLDYEERLVSALRSRFEIVRQLESMTSKAYVAAVADVREQLDDLFGAGYPEGKPWERFAATPGYLRGISYRLEHLQGRVDKDLAGIKLLRNARERLIRAAAAISGQSQGADSDEIEALWVAREQWRLALFAEPLALHQGMSNKKFSTRLASLETRLGLR